MNGWHFVRADLRLGYDMAGVEVQPGQTYHVSPPLALCKRGLHASERALDALKYAGGPIICRVALGGEILRDTDKAVATERRVLWLADASRVLHDFAVWCAQRALSRERQAGREPDQRSWAALEVKRRWLDGQATDEELARADATADIADATAATGAYAAKYAAAYAAYAAKYAAAYAAHYAAAHAAYAAHYAAAYAAYAANAAHAARAAAYAAERQAQHERLEQMLWQGR